MMRLLLILKFLIKKLHQNRVFSIIFLFSLFLITSCSNQIENNLQKNQRDKPFVLTTFTVLADIARNVAGDSISVESITKFGAEIHGYKPTPSDLVKASKADLIIENGLGLELWSRKFTSTAGDIPVIVLTDGMKPLLIEGDIYNGKPNPHAWMSPKRAMKYVDRIVEAFSDLDPTNANTFKLNGENYKKKIELLDIELRNALALIPPKQKVLVTCEGAFSYLADDYGLEEAYLWPVNAESQVTPKRMLKLINKVKTNKVPTIFCESTVSSKAQEEVAKSSGASFGGTFYVDSLSGENGPASTFLDLQRHNVRLILQGLALEIVD